LRLEYSELHKEGVSKKMNPHKNRRYHKLKEQNVV